MKQIHRNWIALLLDLCLVGLPNISSAAKWKAKALKTTRILRKELSGITLLEGKAKNGDKAAQYDLGVRYLKGNEVPKDYSKSLLWLKKSAEQGFPQADYNLGA